MMILFKELKRLAVSSNNKYYSTILLLIIISIYLIACDNTSLSSSINFEDDIKPIIKQNCAGCHNPEGFAPFNLLNYKDVSKRAAMIVEVTESGYMPPWHADTSYSQFANQRGISSVEIEKIKSWIKAGKPKGTFFSKAINPKQVSKLSGLSYLEISPPKPITVQGDNREHFIKVIVPFDNAVEIPIQGISFTPRSRKYTHHSNFAIFATPDHVVLKADYPTFVAGKNEEALRQFSHLFGKQVHYSGWVPGSSPIDFGAGNGFMLPRKGVILLTLHYSASPLDFSDSPVIKLYKAEDTIKHTIQTISLGSGGIGEIVPEFFIPANQISNFNLLETIPFPIEVLYVWPHMHLLGKSMEAEVVTKTNETLPLIRINRWDFDWQEGYQLKHPLLIPAGSQIKIKATYDNTTKNLRNPNNPPQDVGSTGFMESDKEMMTLVLIFRLPPNLK